MRVQNKNYLSFAVALMMTSAAPAQRRTPPATPTEVGVAITLQVAGQRYQFEGKAARQHAPVASIYNVMAEMWRVQQSDGQRTITLTRNQRFARMVGQAFSLSGLLLPRADVALAPAANVVYSLDHVLVCERSALQWLVI